MRVLGIDPGLYGALAIVDNGKLTDYMLMPTHALGRDKRVNSRLMAKWLFWANPDHVVIEKVSAMPGNGVTSMFNFGVSYGIALATVQNLGFPLSLIHPKDWKALHGFTGMDKDYPRTMAMKRWPNIKDFKFVGKGQAIADAAFIALSIDSAVPTALEEDKND